MIEKHKFECLNCVVSNSGVSAWLPPVLDLKSLCGRSTLGGGLRLGAHGSPTHHTALTTHLFKMPYILRHLVNDWQKDVLYFKEETVCISWGLPAGHKNQGLLMSQFAQFYIIHFLNLLIWKNYQVINIYMIDSKAFSNEREQGFYFHSRAIIWWKIIVNIKQFRTF